MDDFVGAPTTDQQVDVIASSKVRPLPLSHGEKKKKETRKR